MIHRTAVLSLFALAAALLLWSAGAIGQAAPTAAVIGEKLMAANRSEADQARDAGRKPAEVVAFLGVRPGMTALDLVAAGGYYTEVLSVAVGPDGKVYAQNNEVVLKMRDGANEKALSARLADGRLPNVERLDSDLAESGLAPETIDVAITALNFHDIVHGGGDEAAAGFLAAVHALLKPGGALVIVDHVGVPDTDNEKLHRIDPTRVEELVAASPFALESRSEILANPEDDHTLMVFAPEIRGQTDRFVFRLRKAASE